MTLKDEIVAEVRKVRDDHAAKFNYDISAICKDIRQKQIKSGRKIVVNTTVEKEQVSELLKVA